MSSFRAIWTIRTKGKAIDTISLLTFVLPQAAFAFTVCVACLFVVIRNWSGSMMRTIILKLVEILDEKNELNEPTRAG